MSFFAFIFCSIFKIFVGRRKCQHCFPCYTVPAISAGNISIVGNYMKTLYKRILRSNVYVKKCLYPVTLNLSFPVSFGKYLFQLGVERTQTPNPVRTHQLICAQNRPEIPGPIKCHGLFTAYLCNVQFSWCRFQLPHPGLDPIQTLLNHYFISFIKLKCRSLTDCGFMV